MTPKEKALELYRKYRGFNVESEPINHVTAIQCAGLCVDEIIYTLKPIQDRLHYNDTLNIEYWQEVKIELERL